MADIKKTEFRDFSIYQLSSKHVEPPVLIDRFLKSPLLEQRGRGGIRLITIDNRRIACRKYIHGGILRALTKDYFISDKRALDELKIIQYLKKEGFPVIEPYCAMIRKDSFLRKLHILTVFEEDSADLVDYLKKASAKTRLRIIKKLAYHFRDMEKLGIYHPDLHLNNILVTKEKKMIFLDFDRAEKKQITPKDMEKMFWRLNRYADKMARQVSLNITKNEKLLFLRAYQRLSGYDIISAMSKKATLKSLSARAGWLLEHLLYKAKS